VAYWLLLLAGGSLCACLDALISRGAEVSSIRVVGAVAAPPALKRLSEMYPGANAPRAKLAAFKSHAPCWSRRLCHAGLRVFVAMIDEEVNASGQIVPGLGDAGDRAFGTAAWMS
jgi:uracil phosphoribosyltransferase